MCLMLLPVQGVGNPMSGISSYPDGRGTDHYIFQVSPSLSLRPGWYIIYCYCCTKYELICPFYTFYTWATFCLLVHCVGHLMSGALLPITWYSPTAGADRDVITGVSSYPASRGTDHYIFLVSSESGILFCMLSTVISILNMN